jgi:hypothetical protein
MAYAMLVDARARDLRGDVEGALDEIDDELGIRVHWRKRRAAAGLAMGHQDRVAYMKGRTILVDAPKRDGLAAPVVESRVNLPPPEGGAPDGA